MLKRSAKEEAQVWNLEKAYWEYVKGNDLEKYRALCVAHHPHLDSRS
jgi:hypothetical protein